MEEEISNVQICMSLLVNIPKGFEALENVALVILFFFLSLSNLALEKERERKRRRLYSIEVTK